MSEMVEQQKTLIMDQYHRDNAKKMISFSGWEVPAFFSTILNEHQAVRESAGLFDISHMGEFQVTGKQSYDFLQKVLTNDLNRYPFGKAFYSLFCNERGGIIDDLFVYPVKEGVYRLIVNAGNQEKDWKWLKNISSEFEVALENIGQSRALFALQGPASDKILSEVLGFDTRQIKFHHFVLTQFENTELMVSATGYTGERGFELSVWNELAPILWGKILGLGEKEGCLPVGFAARDTLRLEAGCALYGHELSEDINPFEAKLGWIVSLTKKEDFIGKEKLVSIEQKGVGRKLFGIIMTEPSVPREHYEVYQNGKKVGEITSGSYFPTLKKNGAMAFFDMNVVQDEPVDVKVRERFFKAQIVKTPFYRSQTKNL